MELRTDIWAAALLRRAQAHGASAVIARKGDAHAGAVLVKVSTLDGRARLFAPARDGAGEKIWLDLSSGPLGDSETQIEAVCAKRAAGDPDLWIVDIEDRQGRHFLTEPVAP